MKRMKYISGLGAIILMLGLLACEGPAGPQGSQGPQGQEGPQGEQGPEGTANVIYSDWIQLSDLSSPADTTVISRNYTRYQIPAPELTQEIIDNGAILVYYKLLGMTTQLPFTLAGIGSSEDLLVTYAPFTPGRITILSQLLDNTPLTLNSNTQFRYILIPGGTPAKKALPDFSNYLETVKYFNIDP